MASADPDLPVRALNLEPAVVLQASSVFNVAADPSRGSKRTGGLLGTISTGSPSSSCLLDLTNCDATVAVRTERKPMPKSIPTIAISRPSTSFG
jgi:hypothetical protein